MLGVVPASCVVEVSKISYIVKGIMDFLTPKSACATLGLAFHPSNTTRLLDTTEREVLMFSQLVTREP